ncbi:MAG TPA: RIP metalloprotease RseP [Burkholderiaceae bacterium]|nr:RIP metalloprotease RseP [Burkholderiaceae bacterium]
MTTALAFLVTLGVLIVVHEWGHYRMARACGVKVLRFSVGFGRTLWKWRRGDTEFVVALLPLGGYVRMLDEREGEVLPQEADQAFNRKPLAQRAAVVLAGPLANLLLAVLLYAGVNWIGADEPKAVLSTPLAGTLAERAGMRAGEVVRAWSRGDASSDWNDVRSMTDLRWEIMQAALDGQRMRLLLGGSGGQGTRQVLLELDRADRSTIDGGFIDRVVGLGAPYAEAVIGDVVPGGPADRAGLRAGDRVLRVDGEPMQDAAQLRRRIRLLDGSGAPPAMQWQVERAGRVLDVPVQPRVMGDGRQRIGRIDAVVGHLPATVTVRWGPVEGLAHAARTTWEQSLLTLKMFGRMLTGEASLKNLSGPITIADYAGQSAERGLTYYIGFLALVSVGLGVLNLLPVPMLDGGHLMYYLFEAITGHPVSDQWLLWLQRGGALALLVLMSLALSNDVARLLGLH